MVNNTKIVEINMWFLVWKITKKKKNWQHPDTLYETLKRTTHQRIVSRPRSAVKRDNTATRKMEEYCSSWADKDKHSLFKGHYHILCYFRVGRLAWRLFFLLSHANVCRPARHSNITLSRCAPNYILFKTNKLYYNLMFNDSHYGLGMMLVKIF